jgi:hypothetical protein
MGSEIQQKMNRAIGGTIHEIITSKTDLDLKGIYDPEPFILLHELKDRALKRKRAGIIRKQLVRAEKELTALQYQKILRAITEDTTILSLVAGHQKLEGRDPLTEALE